MQDRLSSFMDRRPKKDNNEAFPPSTWAPLVDISETEKEYLVTADLPEIRKEDLKVTVENGALTISGERKYEQEDKSAKVHRLERAYGKFVRTFALPDNADAEKVKAEFKDGVLKVRVGKHATKQPRQIEVH